MPYRHTETIEAPFAADEETPYIFISYAHKSRDVVFPFLRGIYEKGWRIWYDEGLEIGGNYYTSLKQHILDCEVFLLVVTKAAAESRFVMENEIPTAISAGKIIVVCSLDGTEITLPDDAGAIRTDPDSITTALLEIPSLIPGGIRSAKGHVLNISIPPVDDEYDYMVCDGGVQLQTYKGSEKEVFIPEEYPPFSGLKVKELDFTFDADSTVTCVHVPHTVEFIGWDTFCSARSIVDIYIPSSVKEVLYYGIVSRRIHCTKGSAAYKTAEEYNQEYMDDAGGEIFEWEQSGKYPVKLGEEGLLVIITDDEGLNEESPKESDVEKNEAFAFISCSSTRRTSYEALAQKLKDNGCHIEFEQDIPEKRKESLQRCSCVVVLVDASYANSRELEELRFALKCGKPTAVYITENAVLPDDMADALKDTHQLRYDTGSRNEQLIKLLNWLSKHECREEYTIKDYHYNVTESGVVLEAYTGKETEVHVAGEYGGVPVVSIGNSFQENNTLSLIELPDSLTDIDPRAFMRCTALKQISLPDGIRRIGYAAFLECIQLEKVRLSQQTESIDGHAFWGCESLRSVTIPGNTKVIGEQAFRECTSLETVVLEEGVEQLGFQCFYDCCNLKQLSLPQSLIKIGKDAFGGCDQVLTRFENAYYLGNEENPNMILVRACSKDITSCNIADGTRFILEEAFKECTRLNSIELPNSIISIGERSFENCVRLQSLRFPSGLSQIEDCTCMNCSVLKEVVLPEGLKRIGVSAFYGCTCIENLTVPESVNDIGLSAFKGAYHLTVHCTASSFTRKYCQKNRVKHKTGFLFGLF